MRTRLLWVGVLAILVPVAVLAGQEAPPPPGIVTVALPDRSVTLWPYAASDYSGTPYDPVNLFFPDSDPREIRQALLALDGERGLPPELPFGKCVWADAMGSEQVAWAEAEGWVGGEVQLVCIDPDEPLGDPFRLHLRLYREGDVTLGAAHFEILIPGTAGHEVLSWDFARNFVVLDMGRTNSLIADPTPVGLQPGGTFREILRPIYDALYYDPSGDGLRLLIALGLAQPPPAPAPPPGNVPIPTNGVAIVLAAQIELDPVQEKIYTRIVVPYDVVTPRPFCADGPLDVVHLAGPVRLTLEVHTNPSGKYERRHRISGNLSVTPLAPDGMGGWVQDGPPTPARVRQNQRGILTDHHGQLTEAGLQKLLSSPPESLRWILRGGSNDRYREKTRCQP